MTTQEQYDIIGISMISIALVLTAFLIIKAKK